MPMTNKINTYRSSWRLVRKCQNISPIIILQWSYMKHSLHSQGPFSPNSFWVVVLNISLALPDPLTVTSSPPSPAVFQEAGSHGTPPWALMPPGFRLGLALANAFTGDQEKGVEYFRTCIPQDAPLQNLHGLKQRVPSPQATLSTQLPFTLVDFFL